MNKIIYPDCGLYQDRTEKCILCKNDHNGFYKAEKWWRSLRSYDKYKIYKLMKGIK